MKKQMNLGGLAVAAQILGIPGAFAGPWGDGMAAYNRGDYLPELRVLIRPSFQDVPIGASCRYARAFSRQGFGCAEATAPRNCVATVNCPIFFPISFPTSVEKR